MGASETVNRRPHVAWKPRRVKGDVLEPEDGLIGIGSGGNYALAAARALMEREDMDAEDIARKAMQIAADICVYTNESVVLETV